MIIVVLYPILIWDLNMMALFRAMKAQQLKVEEIIAGDANCDGGVDLADAVMVMQALANPNKYGLNGTAETHITEQGIKNADVVGNNGMTTEDAGTIQRYLLKLIDKLPVKK